MPLSDRLPSRRRILGAGAALAAAPLIAGPFSSAANAAAPLLGPYQPKFWRYRLGDFELTMISDSEAFIDGPYPIIGKNASEDEVRALMRANLVQEGTYQPGFTPAIVNTGKTVVLFDTGNGENGFVGRPKGGWLAAQLAPAGFKAEDIDVVVLSHGHPDHVGGVMDGGKPLFPNARYVTGQIEYDFWSPEGKHSGEMEKLASVFRTNTRQVADRFTFLQPGSDIVPGIRAIEAYGHTPGHLAFMIESAGRQMLFWGDCAHHHVASLARPDWHCMFDVDKEKGAATRKRVYDMAATDQLAVIGYHMPFPSIGYVERIDATSYRWVPHAFQFNL